MLGNQRAWNDANLVVHPPTFYLRNVKLNFAIGLSTIYFISLRNTKEAGIKIRDGQLNFARLHTRGMEGEY